MIKAIWASAGYKKLEFREIRLQALFGLNSTILCNPTNDISYLYI